jgi:TolB-like protein/DNA-binding SARP family transcriptional activator
MDSLELDLFGGFQARAAGRSVDVPGRKERALLAILALPLGEPRSRYKLAGLLWSDRGDKQARDSLKSAISRLKEALGSLYPLPIVSERESVSLDRTMVAVDVAAFERLICEGTPESIAQATTLYRGDLLDGLDVRDPAFEEWLLLERQRLRVLVRDALGALLDKHLASGARESAAPVAHRLLALDPLREGAHRALMQIYAEQGQTTLALKQYQLCCDALQRELDVKPEPETDRLYRSIREKRATIRSTVGESKVTLSVTTLPLGASPPPEPEVFASVTPAVAVLPFTNMSGDLGQEYFSDGITEDIITALSKLNDLLVIARNSTFAYKGRALDVKQVGRELGVRHVLEGSVRKLGQRVRVSAQLIDATTGHHLWAERYDRELGDIFAVQAEITRQVVIALDIRLRAGEQARFWSSGTENLEAWENVRLGMDLLSGGSLDGLRECQRLCDRALELDPNYATAWAMRGWTHHNEVDVGIGRSTTGDRQRTLDLAIDCARKALKIDPSCVDAHSLLGICHLSRGEYEQAIDMCNKALALAPNHSDILAISAVVHNKAGQPQRSLNLIKKAMRLCPIYPGTFLWILGTAYRLTGQMEAAVGAFQEAIKRSADFLAAHVALASTLGEMGLKDSAKTSVTEILRLDPDFSIRRYMYGLSYRNSAEAKRFEYGLREAELPT